MKALIEIPIERYAFKFVDNYFALDERIANWLPENADGKTVVMTIGVNETIFPIVDKKLTRELLNLDVNKNYILYVGIIDYHKRVDLLIDAFKEIKPKYPNAELLIAGNFKTDPLYTDAEKAEAILCGRILQTAMYKYLTAADCYVLPDLLPIHTFGGIGELPVQALLCNTPIVGGTVCSIPAKVRDKVGIFTQTKDELIEALKKILDLQVQFTDLRKTAIDIYSWKNVSLKTRVEYDRLVKEYWHADAP